MTIHTYKVRLETMREDIIKELRTIGIHDPQNTQDWIAVSDATENNNADLNVVADSREDLQERQSLLAELETDYNAIVQALHKIELGTFGTCEICNTPIETKRLDAHPSARTCITHINTPTA